VVQGRKLVIGEPPGRTESYLVRGDEAVCEEIPRKEQRVSTGVLEHDAQETAALFGGCRLEDAMFINYAISSSLALWLVLPFSA
jgi:hypothetical protein